MRHNSPELTPVRVGLLLSRNGKWTRAAIHGIQQYALQHKQWRIIEDGTPNAEVLFGFERHWDGILAYTADPRVLRRLRRLKAPVVNLSSRLPFEPPVANVVADHTSIAKTVARHLLSAGYSQFAYVDFARSKHPRGQAFAEAVGTEGSECTFYLDHTRLPELATIRQRVHDLQRWLRRLPKPIGLMAWNAHTARVVVEAIQRAGLAIPGEVGIVAGDDDEIHCEIAEPAISAVAYPGERIGRVAAETLHTMMTTDWHPDAPIVVPTDGVLHIRASSEPSRVDGWDVGEALNWIERNLGTPFSIEDVCRATLISRRSLERQFVQRLGITPHQHILLHRIERAKKLLIVTDWPLERVATECGFGGASYFCTLFRQQTGQTPTVYRRLGR